MLFEILKSRWNYFAQAGVMIITILGTFLVTPPMLSYSSESRVESFSRFIITSLLAFLYIPLKGKSAKRHYISWYRVAGICFISGILAIAVYAGLLKNWSVRYYHDKVLVIGSNMFPEALENKLRLANELYPKMVDNELFVKSRGGETRSIWPQQELTVHFYLMSALYILCAILIGGFIVTIIQAIYCYEIKE